MTFLSMPAPEDPMLKRPELRMFIATLNPPPTSPMTFSTGTGVLSKNTSHAKMSEISRRDVTSHAGSRHLKLRLLVSPYSQAKFKTIKGDFLGG